MKQSTAVLLFGVIYAGIALTLVNESLALSLTYAMFSALTAGLHCILDSTDK